MDLDQFNLRVRKLKNIKISQSTWTKVANECVDFIKDEMQKGIGTDQSGNAKPYEPLKPFTIDIREYLEESGDLDSRTSPDTSNQISSGTLIDGIHYKITDTGIEISPSEDRKDIAEYQEDLGNYTFYLRNTLKDTIIDLVKDEVVRKVTNLFKN